MTITTETTLHLNELEIRKDKKNYIVEDKETQEFYEMPVVCIDAIGLINTGLTLGDIEAKLIEKYPDEDINMIEFVEQLIDLDLVRDINGEIIGGKSKKREN